jgi:cardiolipin synthase
MPDGSIEHATGPKASLRQLAEQTLCRVAGASLTLGNTVEPLIDARANFDAWLSAISAAKSSILFANYIFTDDDIGRRFRDTLTERARAGVQVKVIRDWLGCIGESRDRFWAPLRAAGGEVRTYNPFHFARPIGWISRDHRKLLVVDDNVAFVSGVCVSAKWLGDPAKGIPPWRDTGVSVRGPAVRDVAVAFAESWAELGPPLPPSLPVLLAASPATGDVALRVVATVPRSTGNFRLDLMIAALARKSLWITDAYFMATAPYVQALSAAARDGVDVRLLVPGTSDVPFVGALSRTGYRPLLEAGVRVFEWNGSMMHAKSAVADGHWARVGSTNLNIASWDGNLEMDVAVEDDTFAGRMAAQYERDLRGATEIVLGGRRDRHAHGAQEGSAGRRVASTMRLAHTVGAVLSDRCVPTSAERGIVLGSVAALSALAALAFYWPRALAWPVAVVAAWFAITLFGRYLAIHSSAARPSQR